MSALNKSELIAAVAERVGITKSQALATIDALFDTITDQTEAGKIVKIVGFGKFEKKTRAARIGRNPSTGAEIQIPESTALTFKAGKPKAVAPVVQDSKTNRN